jgi:hypothetical protein
MWIENKPDSNDATRWWVMRSENPTTPTQPPSAPVEPPTVAVDPVSAPVDAAEDDDEIPY